MSAIAKLSRLLNLLILVAAWAVLVLYLAAEARAQAGSEGSVNANIRIDSTHIENQISSDMYGQFMEFMFQDIKGGLHAELIRNRSFEEAANEIGLSRYWEREPDDRNDDSAMRFHWDGSSFYPAHRKPLEFDSGENQDTQHSLRITIADRDDQRRGIRQGGIPVRAGISYKGYFWLRTNSFEGHITVELGQDQTGGETYATTEIPSVAGDWKKYDFTLTPTKSDSLAKLALLFYGKGEVWVDQVSLIPGNAPGEVRKDVFDRIQFLHPAFLRWPGGNVAQDYHWMWAIGSRDQRTTWTNLSWWNEHEPGDFGTDEYIQFCRNLQSQPSITVNVEGRGATAQEAAAWVEYVNGDRRSKYGMLRAANGHPEPFNVHLWEVGNEIWGDWVRGHSDAETYARNFNRYEQAMHAVDKTIKLIAVGDNDLKWDQTVMEKAGKSIDFLAIHHYYGAAEMQGDPANLMAHPLAYERFYRKVHDLVRKAAPGHETKLVINEWNTSLPVPRQHSMESALYAARLMNVFERSGEIIGMTAVSDLVNGWSGGIIQASRNSIFVTPTFWVNKLYQDHLGTSRLATQVDGPVFNTTKEGKNIPYLDVVVSRSADGKNIFIKAVNTDPRRVLNTAVSIAGAGISEDGVWDMLNGPELDSSNSFEHPDNVAVKSHSFKAGATFNIQLPAHSVSTITLKTK